MEFQLLLLYPPGNFHWYPQQGSFWFFSGIAQLQSSPFIFLPYKKTQTYLWMVLYHCLKQSHPLFRRFLYVVVVVVVLFMIPIFTVLLPFNNNAIIFFFFFTYKLSNTGTKSCWQFVDILRLIIHSIFTLYLYNWVNLKVMKKKIVENFLSFCIIM